MLGRSCDHLAVVARTVAPEGLRHIAATRYVLPLREGGSLPALIEADDDGMYVLKFRGAGQGPKALVAEVIVAELARALAFETPELALVELDPALALAEPDAEIQDLLRASAGLNLGVDYLPGAIGYSAAAEPAPDADYAADVVWLDALTTNVDRTARNPNLLWWHERLWLIDHGAALFFHHDVGATAAGLGAARGRFPASADHVLLPRAASIAAADERLADRAAQEVPDAVAAVPEEWLGDVPRETYLDFLLRRLEPPRDFVYEAERARRG